MTIIQKEARKERARKLYTIPREIDQTKFDKLSKKCRTDILRYYGRTGNQYILNKSVGDPALQADDKFAILQCLTPFNGIRMVLVTKVDSTNDQADLDVHFYNRNYFNDMVAADKVALFPISGGHRIIAGPATGQIRVTKVIDLYPNTPQQAILRLTVQPIGDYSTYTLSINTSIKTQSGSTIQIDPLFSEIDFKFRPGCFGIDCAPEWKPAPAPKDNPTIDYLAKDYESFKHTAIAAMIQRVPGWQPTGVVGVVLCGGG
jgi:hypothetical protein